MKTKLNLLAVIAGGLLVVAPGLTRAQPASAIIAPGDRTSGRAGATLRIAEGGKALQPIVIAENASDAVKATAADLAEKLARISGAPFQVQAGDGSRGIVLGTIEQFPVAALKQPLQVREASVLPGRRNGLEAYGIRTETDRLLLLGGGELGVSHAASRFLELLGYRRFYPAREWEIVPELKSLSFSRNETDRPTILARHIWYAFGVPVEPTTTEAKPEERAIRSRTDLPQWYRQNRLGASFQVYAAHNYATLLAQNKDEFEKHPEYRILLNGERSVRGICTSQPAVREMGVKSALAYFEKNPNADMYSMERGDGSVMCECELCTKVGNDSNRVFGFANYVAAGIRKRFPDKMIGVLAYNHHDVPPDFAMEPNVHVQVARLFIQGPHDFRTLIKLWSQKTKNLGIYDYFSTFQWGQDRLRPRASAGPTGDIALLKADIPYMAEHGVLSLWSESSVAWGAHGRGKMVAARLMWDPTADVQPLLQDFYSKAFGPAAPVMQRYFERVDGQNEVLPNSLLGVAMRDVDEAAKLAKDRPDVQARLDHIKQFLYYNYLIARHSAAKTDEERKPLFLEMLTHEFRTRYAFMTHWHARTNYLADYAKRYKDPSWEMPSWKVVAQNRKEGKPVPKAAWEAEPYTREETEKRFQEAMHYFQPLTVLPRVAFSEDLVPVQWPDAPPATPAIPGRSVQAGRGEALMYCSAGEALEIDIKAGKGAAPAPYVVYDTSGKVVGKGTVAQDEGDHTLKIPVPAAGLYRFEYAASLNHLVQPGRGNTISLERNEGTRYTLQGHGGRNFFYVPKGTTQLQYYWNGGEHYVYDPTGKVLEKVGGTNDYVTIAVPAGMDGKVWSFNGRLDHRVFVNAPNYVAPSPEALMIPRELAVKDGLQLRRAG